MAVNESGQVAVSAGQQRLHLGMPDGAEWKWRKLELPWMVAGQMAFPRGGGMIFGCQDSLCEVSKSDLLAWKTLTVKNVRKTFPNLGAGLEEGRGLALLGVGKDRWGRVWARDWQRVFVANSVAGPYRQVFLGAFTGSETPVIRLSPAHVTHSHTPVLTLCKNERTSKTKYARNVKFSRS